MKTYRSKIRPVTACRCDFNEHRRAALVALSCAALELDDMRDAMGYLKDADAADGLDEAYDEIEHTETRLYDEARALRVFEDEYECSCGDAHAAELIAPSVDDEPRPCTCGDAYATDEELRPVTTRQAAIRLLKRMAVGAALAAFGVLDGAIARAEEE